MDIDTINNSAAQPKAEKRKRKYTAQRVAHLIHSFVGLKLTVLLVIVLFTGTLAVFNQEIDWLIYSEMRATPQGEKMNPGEVYDRVKKAMPEVGTSYMNTMFGTKYSAVSIRINLHDGGFRTVWADPYTGEINGITGDLTVGSFLSRLHTTLFLPLIGSMFVNFLGALCLISLITGILSYRKFWKQFFKKPRWRKPTRVLMGDLHRLLGIWSLWFVLIIGVSGTWWFYQYPLVHYDLAPRILPEEIIPPGLSHEDIEKLGTDIPTALSTKEVIEAIYKHDPMFEVTYLGPPEHNGMAYTVWGTHKDFLTGKWGSVMYVNPFTGEIISKKPASEMSVVERVDLSMYSLHFGTWGRSGWEDLAVKILYFFFGLAMTFLAVSGMIIYYKRTAKATKKILAKQKTQRSAKKVWLIFRPWGGPMSVFKYLNWSFIWFIGVGLAGFIAVTEQGVSGKGYQYVTQNVGKWDISLNAIMGLSEADMDPIKEGVETTVVASLKSGHYDEIKFMYLKVNKPLTTGAAGEIVHGSKGFMHTHLPIPDKIKEKAMIWLTIEDWQGKFYQVSWPLMPDGKMTIDTRL